MVHETGNAGYFIRALLIICFLGTCLGSTSNHFQKVQEVAETKSFQVFYIDSSLSSYQNSEKSISQLIKSLVSSKSPEETTDCSELSSKINASSGSILILKGSDLDEPFLSVSCFSNSGISRIIQVNYEELLRKSEISSSNSENIEDFELRFLSKNLICDSGRFDVSLMSCIENFKRRLNDDSTLNTTYQGYKSSNSIPKSVSSMKNEAITTSFYSYLLEELQNYSGSFDCSSNKISSSNYLDLHTAISDLLYQGLELNLKITETKLDDLFDLTSRSLCTDNFADYLTSSLDLAKPAVYYLESYNKSEASYRSAVDSTFDFFVNFIKKLYPSGPDSSDVVLTHESSLSSNSITVTKDFKTITTDCTCDFCSSSVELLEISSFYSGLGFSSDIFAYKLLKAGDITDSTTTYLSQPEAVSGTGCFSFSKVLNTKGSTEKTFKCLEDSSNHFITCTVQNYDKSSKELSITYTNQGIFAPIRDCQAESGYSSSFECCSDNCTCYSNTKCDVCQTGWAFKDNSCPSCAYQFVDGSDGPCSLCSYRFEDSDEGKCSICSSGYDSSEGAAEKCSVCAQGFKNNTENYKCDICATGWKDDQEGNKCAECNYGFEAADDGTPCSKCSTGYKSSSSDSVTCDECEDGYGKDNDGSCGQCGSHCLCTVSGGCKSCVSGYFYKSSSQTDENSGSCVAGDFYVKASHVNYKYFDPNMAYITLIFDYKINVEVTGADCSAFFVNYGILGTNALCSIKNFKTLLISLGNDFSITSSIGLELTETFLLESPEKSSDPISIQVAYSVSPELTATISGPSKVTISCTTKTFIYSGSLSHGPQKLSLSYSWEVVDSPSGVDLTTYSTSEQVKVTLSSNSPSLFTLKLTVSNSLGWSDSVNFEVTVQDSSKMTFSLDAGSGTDFKRSADISISRVNTDLCSCSEDLTSSWTISPSVSGLALGSSKLKIPDRTLAYGSYTISLDLECGSITGFASISINIISSDLVLILSKSDQKISPSYDLTIDGSRSYDPDGTSLSYSWTYNSQSSDSSSITIPKSAFESLETFQVNFTISATKSRSATQILTFSIIPENPLKVSILGPQTKVSNAVQVVIRAAASSGGTSGTISYQWSQVSGISVSFSSTSSALWISPGKLTGGTAYTFQYKASLDSFWTVATSSFSVNKGAECSSVSVSPSSGSRSQKVSVVVAGCADLDNSDYPLVYKIGIKRNERYSLVLTSYSSVITGLSFPAGSIYVLVEVCDGLKDCWISGDNLVSLTRYLRQSEFTLVDIYLEMKNRYDTIYAIIYILSDRADEKLIRIIWNDFVELVESGSCSDREILDVVLDLLDERQDLSIAKKNLKAYILLVSTSLSSQLETKLLQELETLSCRVTELDKSPEGQELSLLLLQKLLSQQSIDGLSYNKILKNFELSITEDIFSQIGEINKLSLKFDLSEAGFKKNDIVRVEIVSSVEGKDLMFSLNAYSTLYLDSGDFFRNEPVSVLSGSGCKVTAEDEERKIGSCYHQESGHWKTVNCEKFLIAKKNGIYRVKFASDSESVFYNLGPELYTLISLFSIFFLLTPFLRFFDRKAKVHPVNEKVPVSTGETTSRYQTENDYQELKISIFSKHLFLSIFCSSLNLSRTLKLLIFSTVIIFMIFIQVILLGYTGLNLIVSGFLSSFLSLPLSICLVLAFKGTNSRFKLKLFTSLAILLQICCIIGVFLMKSSKDWTISFIIGLAAEIILSETLLMATRLKFRF